MGIARDFGEAFYKATLAAGDILPREGKIFASFTDETKKAVMADMKLLVENGFTLSARRERLALFLKTAFPATRSIK